MPETLIRPYRTADRAALFEIGGDTALFGAPIEAYLDDRRIFLDSFYAYYTDYEPEHIWIAEVDGQVGGFITGCTDTATQERITRQKLMPVVWRRALTFQYRVGWKTLGYIYRMIRTGLLHEYPEVDLSEYPAHLHINLRANCRGLGLGKGLMQAWLDQLRELGIKGVHLGTTDQNVAACKLYEKMGFEILAARKSRMWGRLVDGPVEIRTYGRRIE